MQDPRSVPPEQPDGTAVPSIRRPAAKVGTVLPRDESAPGRARAYLTDELHRLAVRPEAVEDAVLIASELVTNAYRHGRRGDVRLIVSLAAGTLRLTVADQTPYVPLPDAEDAEEDAECGRGLFLVELLSATWGHRPVGGNPECGTAVWAELVGVTA
jgi:anti-sigma regulatory factor (Ser/Thr protein kinase)